MVEVRQVYFFFANKTFQRHKEQGRGMWLHDGIKNPDTVHLAAPLQPRASFSGPHRLLKPHCIQTPTRKGEEGREKVLPVS